MLFVFDMFSSHSVAMQIVHRASLIDRVRLLITEQVQTGVLEHKIGCSPVGTTTTLMAKLVQITSAIWFRYLVWLRASQR